MEVVLDAAATRLWKKRSWKRAYTGWWGIFHSNLISSLIEKIRNNITLMETAASVTTLRTCTFVTQAQNKHSLMSAPTCKHATGRRGGKEQSVCMKKSIYINLNTGRESYDVKQTQMETKKAQCLKLFQMGIFGYHRHLTMYLKAGQSCLFLDGV